MADVGPGPGIVHCVRQVANQDHVLAKACHVPQAEGPAQHAHVRVHPEEHHVGDSPLLQEVPDLDTGIAQRVLVADLQDRRLMEVHLGLDITGGLIVAAAVGLVDRVSSLLFSLNLAAPIGDTLGQVGGLGGRLGSLARGVVLVKLHGAAGRVDHQHASLACLLEKLVDARGHLRAPLPCAGAPVLGPHVADDHRRFLGFPGRLLLEQLESTTARRRLDALPQRQVKHPLGFGAPARAFPGSHRDTEAAEASQSLQRCHGARPFLSHILLASLTILRIPLLPLWHSRLTTVGP
jgi:hypothetical protein